MIRRFVACLGPRGTEMPCRGRSMRMKKRVALCIVVLPLAVLLPGMVYGWGSTTASPLPVDYATHQFIETRAYAAADRAIEKGIKYEAARAEIDNEQ